MSNSQNPPLSRSSMAYRPFNTRPIISTPISLLRATVFRRFVFFSLVLASTFFGGKMIATILISEEPTRLSWSIVCIFTLLFSWIAATFWTVCLGFITLLRKRDRLDISRPPVEAVIHPETRVAIIMPVFNEEVPRIFAGIKTMYESLQETGQLDHFDFFVLSDSDKPEQYEQEEKYWARLCGEVNGRGQIFYRRRKLRLHKKSGNVSDFCRRWGNQYKYLLPLDADSLVSGQLMVDLVKILESKPDIGIVQTSPKGINQKNLSARLQQFSSHFYGPLHLAGSHFWQLNDAGFWGHNALIRMEPFIKYCVLPTLPGRVPFGGEILSHDFVEAALMRRAGWGVWLAYGLEESYEELPPNLIEDLRRDNRWCQGNLQHLRLVFWRGFSLGHRLLFLNGNMAYFSAFLWFILLVLMTAYAVVDFFSQPQYFTSARSLFPQWPVHYHGLSLHLLLLTVVFLFGPKVLSLVWLFCSSKDVNSFGGWIRLAMSVILETIFSIFLAPIKMIFHTWFVISNLCAKKLAWDKQQRNTDKITFTQAFKKFGAISFGAFLWGFGTYIINPTLFLWLLPVLIPLVFSIPLVIFSSYKSIGLLFQKYGIFLTPVETKPSKLLHRFQELIEASQ